MKKLVLALVSIAVIGTGAFFTVQHLEQKEYLASPQHALSQVEKAIMAKDMPLFEKHVNRQTVAQNMLSQMLKNEEAPKVEENTGFMGKLSNLGSSLTKRFADYIQPELQRNIEEQIGTFIQEGYFAKEVDITSIYSQKPLLQKVWQDFSAQGVTYKGISDIEQPTENTATAIATFYRADLDYNAPIELSLEKKAETWRVVRIENLAKTLERIEDLEAKVLAEKNRKIQEDINSALRVNSAKKSTGVSQWGVGKGVMIALALENTSAQGIQYVRANVQFKNEQGETLRNVSIEDTDMISAGDISEKSWSMAINPLSKSDLTIAESADSSLTIQTTVDAITFEDGSSLKLIK